jgi:AcrR family transcriptional regulator
MSVQISDRSGEAADDRQPERVGLRERQRLERDDAILKAALNLIVERGYEALTMEALAECVGISRQTLYHHFSCKEDLILQAILAIMEERMRELHAINASTPRAGRMEAVTRWMIGNRFGPTSSAFVRVRPALMPVKARPEYRQAFDRRSAALAEIVAEAQDSGDIDPSMPAALIVHMLLALACEPGYEDLIESGKATAAELVENITATFLRGIRTRDDAPSRAIPRGGQE